MAKKRVTYKKFMGDDRASWAVFVDGVPKWNGLERREAQYYAKLEEERLANPRPLPKHVQIRDSDEHS